MQSMFLALLLCLCSVQAFVPRTPTFLHTRCTQLTAIGDITSQKELDNVTIRGGALPVIIDFQKSTCKPCKRIAPLFLELTEKYAQQVQFFKVDADAKGSTTLDLLKGNNIRNVPTFQLWRGGKKIDDVQGAHLDDVEYMIKDELKKIGS